MRLLLDTHIAVWAVLGDPRLPETARVTIERAPDDVVVSVVTIWEIAIKHALRDRQRDPMVVSGAAAHAQFLAAGFDILPATAAHAIAVDDLPPLHGDPFDRLIVAQAKTEPMRLMTADAGLVGYSELVMLV